MRPINEVIPGRIAWHGFRFLCLLLTLTNLFALHQTIVEHGPVWAQIGQLVMVIWGLGFTADSMRRAEAF